MSTFPSTPPVATRLPSALVSMEVAPPACFAEPSTRSVGSVDVRQSRAVPSSLAVRIRMPSGLNVALETGSL
jgi:hypothetical protein